MVHTDFFQRSLFETEHAVKFAEDIPVLLRQGIKHLTEQLDAELSIHDLFRRSRELPRHQQLKGIAVIVLRNKIVHSKKMGVVANMTSDLCTVDIHLFCNFVDAVPIRMVHLLCLPNGFHIAFAQSQIADAPLQPACHPPFQVGIQIGGQQGPAFIIFSALDSGQKLQRTLTAKVIQDRLGIAGKVLRTIPVHVQAVELFGRFLGNAPNQTKVPAVQLVQSSLIPVVILTDQFLVGHGVSPAFGFGGRPLGLETLVIWQRL